jgi:ElaB/YqjD/DUF883 family membrane-anchored ribosome-binding protein
MARTQPSRPNLKAQSHRVVEEVRHLGALAVEEAGHAADRLKRRGRNAVAEGRESVERVGDSIREYVVDHPMRSVFLAIGIGALLGMSLLRRD